MASGRTRSIVALVALVVVTSCAAAKAAPSPELTSAPFTPQVKNDEAVMQLTTARCDHEVNCSDVGSDKKFTDRDACARELGRDIHMDLRPDVCPQGIDRTKLATCLELARAERCRHLVDSIDRAMSCRRGELCIH